jgi:D-amino-acid oxidase
MTPRKRIAVVGSGLVGLTCAYELGANDDVTVLHDRDLLDSTSAIATAIWHLYLVDPDDEQNLRWSQITLEKLMGLSDDVPEAGVELVDGIEIYRTSDPEVPPWAHIAIGFEMLSRDEIASDYPGARWGYRIAAPAANMARYLPWLEGACRRRGVEFERRHVESLAELGSYDWIVNCAGLAAGSLVEDPELFPVRGHYLVLEPDDKSPTRYIGDDQHPAGVAYVIPRDGELIVGGTAEADKNELTFDIDEEELRVRAGEFCAGDLANLKVKARVVGLRPARRSRRVKFGPDPGAPRIVHNYGHGGSGFSLAWGCASEIAEIIAGSG